MGPQHVRHVYKNGKETPPQRCRIRLSELVLAAVGCLGVGVAVYEV